jgi:hypothetical protein
MEGVFGRLSWLANGVLFACYHIHQPWAIASNAVSDSLFLAFPSWRCDLRGWRSSSTPCRMCCTCSLSLEWSSGSHDRVRVDQTRSQCAVGDVRRERSPAMPASRQWTSCSACGRLRAPPRRDSTGPAPSSDVTRRFEVISRTPTHKPTQEAFGRFHDTHCFTAVSVDAYARWFDTREQCALRKLQGIQALAAVLI